MTVQAALALSAALVLLAQPVLAQKGPRAEPAADPVSGILIEPSHDNSPVTVTLDGVTATLEGQANGDGTITPLFTVRDARGAAIRAKWAVDRTRRWSGAGCHGWPPCRCGHGRTLSVDTA